MAIYGAFAAALSMGAGVVAIDFGRLVLLRSEMQNSADAAATSAALLLDGTSGSRARAEAVARDAIAKETLVSDYGANIAVSAVNFYSQLEPSPRVTGNDGEAAFVEVVLAPQRVTLLLNPMLDLVSTAGVARNVELPASAIGVNDPLICDAAPLMVCDPVEDGEADLFAPATAGKQMVVKESGGGAMAPGNYGILCPSEDNCGASAVGNAIAAEHVGRCTGSNVDTSPGAQTNQFRNGMNARFDTGNRSNKRPAQNIVSYPRDNNLTGSRIVGNGSWNPITYWSDTHPGDAQPASLSTYTRYQTYLYELGERFARNGAQTLYPVPSPLPAGYTVVNPPARDLPSGGTPGSTPSTDIKRRIVRVAILKCEALGVAGSHSYPTFGRYVDMFLTEAVTAPPVADAYAEVIGPTRTVAPGDVRSNVRLAR